MNRSRLSAGVSARKNAIWISRTTDSTARANPHSRILQGAEVTVIFHGPDAYITPRWYAENNVPTWNYAVVHVRGTVRLLEKYDEIIECLRSLTLQVEATAKDPWEFWLPEDLESPTDLTGAIAGLEIEISDIKGKFKMSQNRSETDRANVVGGLRSDRGDEKSLAVAKPHGKHFFTPARPGVVTSRISERRA